MSASKPVPTNSTRVGLAETPYLRSDLPRLSVGDTVNVSVKVTEGDKQRIQVFGGTVIGIRGGGLGETFTVRRIVAGEGVERIFPYHSPVIAALDVVGKGRVRRAKLTYLRRRTGKGTRLTAVLGEQGTGEPASAAAATTARPSAQPSPEAPHGSATPGDAPPRPSPTERPPTATKPPTKHTPAAKGG